MNDRPRRGLVVDRKLTILMPAWNEQDGIARAVGAALEAGTSLIAEGEVDDVEVLIIDDGSTDATASVLADLAARDGRVRFLVHPHNRGLGGALRTGFGAAVGEFVMYTDADLPFDLGELSKAFRLLRRYDADIVAAYRHDRTGEGPRRVVYSYLYNALTRWMFDLRIRDVNFAAKLIRSHVLDRVELRSEGSFIDVELMAKAQRAGFRTVQFGLDYFPRTRGVSTLSSGKVIRGIAREMRMLRAEILAVEPKQGAT